jgi:hypothetical protein
MEKNEKNCKYCGKKITLPLGVENVPSLVVAHFACTRLYFEKINKK